MAATGPCCEQETHETCIKSIALTVFMLVAACTDPTPSAKPGGGSPPDLPTVSEELCERSDSCNILTGSVEECIQEIDAELAPLPKNQRAEVELLLKQCLVRPSCGGFEACLVELLGESAILRSSSMVVPPESPEAAQAPAETAVEISTQDSKIADEVPAILGGGMCCIDYVCPTNGFEATGCKSGSTGPGPAFRACQQACGGKYCDADGWYCY